jgi:beta-N-acetylhexosaminidase
MNPLAVLMPGFAGTTLPPWLSQRLREGLGGVCLFADNVESIEQLRALTDAIYDANPNAIVSMDEEGGDVTRIFARDGSPFPGNAVLGRLARADLTASIGEQVGWELRNVGVGLALAPDVDVNSNPSNPVIGVRSFGADADAVALQSAAWTRGLESTGVASCAKHFPGHGDTAQDSHLALPVIDVTEHQLRDRDLPPFVAAIGAGARTIMTSHIMVPALDPDLPATFSTRILQGLLRDQLGFEGVVVSDALDMAGASATRGIPAAAVLAIGAGVDLLCIGTDNTDQQIGQIVSALNQAIGSPTLTGERLSDAIERVGVLGRELARSRRELPLSDTFVSGTAPGFDSGLVASAFHVTSRAHALLDAADRESVAWVRLDTTANIAVGTSPWGPFGDGGVGAAASIGAVGDIDGAISLIPSGATVIVVGKDNHRRDWTRAAIDAFRASFDTIAVDMGWPDPTYEYADIATFGASRLVADALLTRTGLR